MNVGTYGAGAAGANEQHQVWVPPALPEPEGVCPAALESDHLSKTTSFKVRMTLT